MRKEGVAMSHPQDMSEALEKVAAKIGESENLDGIVRDGNGNTVGHYLLGDTA